MKLLRAIASLWTTLAGLLSLAALLIWSEIADVPVGATVALPFVLLGLNLLAALAVTARLRSQSGLLVFHLGLAALALLAAYGALASLSGHVEVTQGGNFDPTLVDAKVGPLHPWHLDRVRFLQGDFSVNYAPGMKRRETVSHILVPAGDKLVPEAIGDDRPLIVGGYRFYTSFNKGFAPLLAFIGADGLERFGAVHLPSYPLNDFRQGTSWRPPGGRAPIKLWLHLPKPLYAEDAAWRFHIPGDATLVVMEGAKRAELKRGEKVAVAGGTLRFEGVTGWMGYTIAYDPTTPWMVAAALTAVLGLAWHIAGKLWRASWRQVASPDANARETDPTPDESRTEVRHAA